MMKKQDVKTSVMNYTSVKVGDYAIGYNGNEDPQEDPDGNGNIWAITKEGYGFVLETDDIDEAVEEFMRLACHDKEAAK